MRDLLALLVHLMTTLATLLGRGGTKAVVAESLLLKHQLLIINRARRRAPNLCAVQRLLLGFWSLFLHPRRVLRNAVILKPSTLLRFHTALKTHKYRWFYSRPRHHKPGLKGPAPELIRAIVELKRRNFRFGCPRIAQRVAKTFGIKIDKDVVRRILAAHYRPDRDEGGSSWLTLLGHAKDSLWSTDFFQVESVLLRTHWILVVMDHFTRKIIGFAVQAGAGDGVALCRMFNRAISGQGLPVRLSLDHDPLFDFERWQANLHILEIQTIRTAPHVPRIRSSSGSSARFVGSIWTPSFSGTAATWNENWKHLNSTTTITASIKD